MASNVLAIGPPEEGGAEDEEAGLKAGVAPGDDRQGAQTQWWQRQHLLAHELPAVRSSLPCSSIF